MTDLTLVALIHARPAHAERVRAVLAHLQRLAGQQPGCRFAGISQREDDPSGWLLRQVWQSAPDFRQEGSPALCEAFDHLLSQQLVRSVECFQADGQWEADVLLDDYPAANRAA